MLLEELPDLPNASRDASKHGWCRPLYALSQGSEIAFGHLERDGSSFALLHHSDSELKKVVLPQSELPNLRRVCGVIVPV
jgi:hypothetical protein